MLLKDDTVLLLFDKDHPCWDEETIALAGEDGEGLQRLKALGLLQETNSIYSLTEKGKNAFKELCKAQFVVVEPGTAPSDYEEQEKILWRTRLQCLLDNSFIARWGIKEYHTGKILDYVPGLSGQEICRLQNFTSLEWTYLSNPDVEKIKREFPVTGLKAREIQPWNLEQISAWLEGNRIFTEQFVVDLLYLSRYDFAYYMKFPKHPNDVHGLINADRFFFFRALPPFEEHLPIFLETIGKVHLFLLNQRHMYIPGYVDLDWADQDSLSWVIWVTETEEEALSLLAQLSPFGSSLIEPAKPMDIWIISIEGLKGVKEKQETLFDLFSFMAHPVARTI